MAYPEYLAACIGKSNLAIHRDFKVGVYLETNSYSITTGNVEHTNSRLTLCAEMLALAQAKSAGLTPKHLHMVTDSAKIIHMCGVCRQYASEWPKLKITSYNKDGTKFVTKTSSQLLPSRFIKDICTHG